MKKNGNEKMKKMAVVAGLLAVGGLAVAGICMNLKREEPQYIVEELAEPETTPEPVSTEIKVDVPEPAATPEIVVAAVTIPEDVTDRPEQSIQPDPVRTQEQKPEDPPEEAKDVENEQKENPPANNEIPAVPSQEPTGSEEPPASSGNGGGAQNGTVQDGKIYIEGFGWIDYNGGGSNVVQGGDIYENGNTIGIMD